jgi:uncharacterized protein (DUF2141 family)
MISSVNALAQSRHADDDEEPDEEISAIGQELGLELYESDKSDYCVENGLQIRVTVNHVTKEGILKLELYGEHNFLRKSGKLRLIRVPAEEGSQKLCINVPTPGSYAVAGYHDVDGNRRLKKAWNFKPLEPYGLSNNPEIKALRLPKFSETSFYVPLTGTDITINLVDLTK